MTTGRKIAFIAISVFLALGVGVGAIIAVPLALGTIADDDPQETASGPLLIRPAHGWSVPVEVGDVFVDGSEQLFTVRGTASIVSIEIEGDSAIRLIGSSVAGHSRKLASVQYFDAWPLTDADLGPVTPSAGTRFGTREADAMGIELFVAMKLDRPGHYLRKGIWVTYVADGATHRDFIEAELSVCSPDFLVDGQCPFLGQGAP